MADLNLDAIEARANAATRGSWSAFHWDDEPSFDRGWAVTSDAGDDWVADYLRAEDVAFIAHARTDVPALVAEVRRLRERTEAHAVTIQQAVSVERQRDEARAEAQRATAWHMEALDDLARAVRALDTSKAIASERRARVNRLVEAVERERAERLALTALLNAKQSWIDGAKVDLDGYADAQAEYEVAVRALTAAGDEARAEAERLMQEVERLHNAVRAAVARVEGDES